MSNNIPERKETPEVEGAEKVKKRMPKFIEWRQDQIEQLSDDFKEKAEEVAKSAKREGFWMNKESIFDLQIIHDLDLDKIEDDIMNAVEEAFGDEED